MPVALVLPVLLHNALLFNVIDGFGRLLLPECVYSKRRVLTVGRGGWRVGRSYDKEKISNGICRVAAYLNSALSACLCVEADTLPSLARCERKDSISFSPRRRGWVLPPK